MSVAKPNQPGPARRRRAAEEPEAAAGPQDKARVLVVDDDEHNLLAIRTVLEDLAEVETAASGEEALRHLLKGEFAVILLDVFMPGMDGYETAQIIRGREQTRRIPIVFLSAVNKEKEHLIRGYSMGAVDYVFKPVESVVLRSKVAVFVDLFTMTREVQRKAEQEQRLLDENLRANAERLRIEQQLRLAEQQQTAIISSLPIILYLEPANADPRVPQFVGGNFAALTGFPFEAVAETPTLWADRLHPDDRDRVLRVIAERRETGVMAIEYRWRCADDQYKHFLDQAVLLHGEGEAPLQYAGTLLDVTDRKDLENQLLQAHKMDAIGKLTGGIAHDFNNLLAAILGGLGMIERRLPLDEDHLKIVGMTKRAAEQGAELVGRLLAFSRRQQLRPAAIHLPSLSTSVTEILTHTLGGLVEIDWEIAADIWPAYADATQLELALMNLIINARDAMPDGGVITVTGENRRADTSDARGLPEGDYVVLTVKDRGTGIPAEMIGQVMEPFFTTKEVGKGTGLGLSMVYGFARQSGGAIDIQSRLGEGTEIEIWLPRSHAKDAPLASERGGHDMTRETPSLRILLTDDHEAVRETTAAMLRDMGHQVDAESDGPATLRRLERSGVRYDLMVTDYAMPSMSGDELLKRAKGLCPQLPGIIISGYADTEAISRGRQDIVVLTKPFSVCQMGAAIGAACQTASHVQN